MTRGRHPRAAGQLLETWRARTGRSNRPRRKRVRLLASSMDELSAARAERILAVDEGLIGAIWWLIGVGGVITLLLCAAYRR